MFWSTVMSASKLPEAAHSSSPFLRPFKIRLLDREDIMPDEIPSDAPGRALIKQQSHTLSTTTLSTPQAHPKPARATQSGSHQETHQDCHRLLSNQKDS